MARRAVRTRNFDESLVKHKDSTNSQMDSSAVYPYSPHDMLFKTEFEENQSRLFGMPTYVDTLEEEHGTTHAKHLLISNLDTHSYDLDFHHDGSASQIKLL